MKQIPLEPTARAVPTDSSESVQEILPDVAYRRLAIVNVVYIGLPNFTDEWVLVDAGIAGTAHLIENGGAERFGASARPAAIVMTHGHFDHVGALTTLAEKWNVPIYAHPLELPYLNGSSSYPPAEPSVGGGLMARLSPLYPTSPIDVKRWLRVLPPDGTIPPLPGWRWLHTPGHSAGHISLWREADRTLLAGDAFITTRQESAYAVMTQKPEMHGPPQYFTPDWGASETSVKRLASLEPELVVTGHGSAMHGPEMRDALHRLADNFQTIAVPEKHRIARPT